MKKQLLLVTLALFAGISSYSQNAVHNSDPRPINCPEDALRPMAGKEYTYDAAAVPPGGNFTFWATKDENFITTTGTTTSTNISTALTTSTGLLGVGTNYGVAGTEDKVTIIWSDAILNATTPEDPTFVAVHYQSTDANCADNFRVWEIDPIVAFTVDIKNIENEAGTILGYDGVEDQCFDIVRGATYGGGTMTYNFGIQYLYFEVVAANFSASWTPTFTLTGLNGVQTSVIEYTTTPPPFTAATQWFTIGAVPTDVTETSLGVSIYVRVTITNNNYEGTGPQTINLAVDGQNSVGNWDVINETCAETTGADQADLATQTLLPRPTLTPDAPTPFVPGNNVN